MKLAIREEKVEVPVRLYLEKTRDGFVILYADDGTSVRKALLTFYGDGRVKRVESANIGDFRFDTDGRLIIE